MLLRPALANSPESVRIPHDAQECPQPVANADLIPRSPRPPCVSHGYISGIRQPARASFTVLSGSISSRSSTSPSLNQRRAKCPVAWLHVGQPQASESVCEPRKPQLAKPLIWTRYLARRPQKPAAIHLIGEAPFDRLYKPDERRGVVLEISIMPHHRRSRGHAQALPAAHPRISSGAPGGWYNTFDCPSGILDERPG